MFKSALIMRPVFRPRVRRNVGSSLPKARMERVLRAANAMLEK